MKARLAKKLTSTKRFKFALVVDGKTHIDIY